MICFRDRSFCADSQACQNEKCADRWTKALEQDAIRWWVNHNVPVAFTPMKETCGKFEPIK